MVTGAALAKPAVKAALKRVASVFILFISIKKDAQNKSVAACTDARAGAILTQFNQPLLVASYYYKCSCSGRFDGAFKRSDA